MPSKTWTKSALDELERRRREGWTLQRLGDEYGVTREAIRQVIGRYDLAPELDHNSYECVACRQRVHYGQGKAHRASHPKTRTTMTGYGRPSGQSQTIEAELMDQDIARDYQAGVRIMDISRKYPMPDGRPRAYVDIYRRMRRQGVTPDRGGGRYARTPDSLRRLRESQRDRYANPNHRPTYRGWRATDDE